MTERVPCSRYYGFVNGYNYAILLLFGRFLWSSDKNNKDNALKYPWPFEKH